MDNAYLHQLIKETESRGGGLLLNLEDRPAAVVLTIDKYNQLLNFSNPVILQDKVFSAPMPKNTKNPKSQKVLVTGGAGYIGGHLVKELIKAGYQVVVIDNLVTGKKENLDPNAIFVEGDLADATLLKDLFAGHNFAAVFHMAASLEVGESVEQPEKYFQNNVINTHNLLFAMNRADCKKIIFSSTAAVYGEAVKTPITENSALHPNNPYGSTKLLAERLIKYYVEYLGFTATVFRYFNACGFNLDSRILPTHQSHLIYNVLQVAKGAKPALQVFGNDYETFDGTCIRDYVHVSDIVLPHILALEKMQDVENVFNLYNIGTGKGHSVLEVVTCAAEVTGKIIPMEVAPRRAGDAAVTVADNTKLQNELGYTLKHSILENMISTSWEVIKDL